MTTDKHIEAVGLTEAAMINHASKQPSVYDAVREIVKQLHMYTGNDLITFSKTTDRIFAELERRGYLPPEAIADVQRDALERAAQYMEDPERNTYHGDVFAADIRALSPPSGQWQRVPEGDKQQAGKIVEELEAQMKHSLNAYSLPLWPEEAALVLRTLRVMIEAKPKTKASEVK